jgi:hypothetical protein
VSGPVTHKLSPSASGEHFVLVGPYDADFVALLKDAVPATHREWRPTARVWRILPPFDQSVRDLIGQGAE